MVLGGEEVPGLPVDDDDGRVYGEGGWEFVAEDAAKEEVVGEILCLLQGRLTRFTVLEKWLERDGPGVSLAEQNCRGRSSRCG